MLDVTDLAEPFSEEEDERIRQIWLRAAPRMTRLAIMIVKLRIGRGWSSERVCRRLHISHRKFRRHLLIAVHRFARARDEQDKQKG